MKIQENNVVSIVCELKDDDGNIIDAAGPQDPLVFIQGSGQIVAGLERELMGRNIGEKLEVTLAPKDAYGDRDESLQRQIPREMFQGYDLKVGMQFQAPDEDNNPAVITIKGLDGDNVLVDANHPLAGTTLHYSIEIVDVRNATAQELAHGHAHGPHGHDH